MTKYKKAADRRKEILEAACVLAEQSHYNQIRRHQLVDRCGTAAGNISRIFGSMERLRDELIDYAVSDGRSIVVAQAVVDRHPAVAALSTDDRHKALNAIL